MIIDKRLLELEKKGTPILVGMVGAGTTGQAIALQLGTPIPGIRLAAIANRTLAHAESAFRASGINSWKTAKTPQEADKAISKKMHVLTTDPYVVTACDCIDAIVEVTGTVEAATHTVLDAFNHHKHVVLVNAEIDSLIGPILKRKADEAGVVLTNTDGDEPGVAMNLVRYLRSIGLQPVAAGNIKGMVDHYRTPETQRTFAEKYNQDARKVTSFADATKLSMETTILANATGFRVGQRGMYGPKCSHVLEMAKLLPANLMLNYGLVDYALGAAPYTGAFVIVYEKNPLKKAQLSYYKLGDGPFFVFYTPYHLPHIQIAASIGRAVINLDPTVAPIGGPVCEVLTIAKKCLKAGDTLDGIGGFCVYGLIENTSEARRLRALPISLSEGCVLRRDILKDEMISLDDVDQPSGLVAEALWREQNTCYKGDSDLGAILK